MHQVDDVLLNRFELGVDAVVLIVLVFFGEVGLDGARRDVLVSPPERDRARVEILLYCEFVSFTNNLFTGVEDLVVFWAAGFDGVLDESEVIHFWSEVQEEVLVSAKIV